MEFLDKTGLEHLWAQTVNRLNTKEDLDSKTTIISSSSTNDQYPGAKAVYDFVTANIPDTSTFAKTADLTDGTITVKNAINAEEAIHAGLADWATNDGDGNVITTTYATKTQLTDGSVAKVGTATVGSSTKPIYLNGGVPTAGTYTLGAACAKSVSDSSSASALSSTDTNVPTVRDIYYGLPSINGSHSYTSSKTIYAPESAGSSGQLLTTSGSGAPTWVSKDTTVTSGSSAPVTSGAVYTALTDGSVTKIGNALTVGTTTYDGSAAVNAGRRSWYGTCETAAATSAKEVNDCPGFVLETGAKISVRFRHENSIYAPTLNVNGTGAKGIRTSNNVGTLIYRWYAYQVVEFVYDGNYWILQQPWIASKTYYGLSRVANLSLNGSPTATPSFYAPTVDTGGRWLRGTGLGEPEWGLPINIQDSYTEISSNKTLPDLGVGHTGIICYFTSHSSTYTIYLPSSGEWAFAYQISNPYSNGKDEQLSSAKSIAWRDSSVSGGNAMCSIKGNGKYTSVMIIYTRTK